MVYTPFVTLDCYSVGFASFERKLELIRQFGSEKTNKDMIAKTEEKWIHLHGYSPPSIRTSVTRVDWSSAFSALQSMSNLAT